MAIRAAIHRIISPSIVSLPKSALSTTACGAKLPTNSFRGGHAHYTPFPHTSQARTFLLPNKVVKEVDGIEGAGRCFEVFLEDEVKGLRML
ncbi:hypothetical protein JTE90_005870 [Oedothorax gibbosus]|uniref:Uncharacterized protein n=1 Tax=Oedothorax gibbosus TaxID=931172 RepID=A0AAV6URR6_9ARAC|nr:hypothetical protein JTE90_005870 [Oedothorax gibbosus]